jgi:hypothetical protein
VKHGVLQRYILGPLFFLLYINDLSKIMSDKSNPLWLADAMSIITTNSNLLTFRNNINEVFTAINEWFQGSLFALNYGNFFFLEFVTKKNRQLNTQISFGGKHITNIHSTKYLGLTIDTSMSWKYQTEEFESKLNTACYAIRSIKPFMSLEVLRMTYFSYFNLIILYGKIFWWNSSYSKSIFKIWKRKTRVVMISGMRDSCHELFTQLNSCNLNIHSPYFYLLLRTGTNLYPIWRFEIKF